ncbi:hypothetical protein [Aliikangiella sp. IMCC44359]|uniref:hypothetical protein n=1 Tax=Aliikangiella sp. IMCC44359 TaxID=3459125 RepID=UPI00403B0741
MMSVQFEVDSKYNTNDKRQYINGNAIVFHCHHYISLFTQLADDAKLFEGEKHLRDAAEETFYAVLLSYMKEHPDIESCNDKKTIAEQYFAFIGLGQIKIEISENGGNVEMPYSHVDEGWIKKWGNRDKSVNFIGHGFIGAAFAVINNLPCGSYQVIETQSKVNGADISKFTVTKL